MLDIQKRLLILLKEIDVLCREHDIKWCIMYGTLLGAVRHGGFLPWDDDADIVMTHENWNKFKNAFFSEPRPGRDLTSPDIEPLQHGATFARYHDINKELILMYNTIYKKQTGICIDIFILDNYPDSEVKRHIYDQMLLDYCEVAHKRYCSSIYMPGINNYRNEIIKTIFYSQKMRIDSYINAISSIGDEKSITYIQRYFINHKYDKKIFDKVIYVHFEDTSLPAPERYYEALCLSFGEDWMYMPEIIHRHTDNILSEKQSGNSIVSEYFSDKGIKHEIHYFITKWLNVRYTPDFRAWKLDCRHFTAELLVRSFANGDQSPQGNGTTQTEISEALAQYIAFQTSPWFIGRYIAQRWWNWLNHSKPYLISIDDHRLTRILHLMLQSGGINHVCMILMARENIGREIPDELEKIYALVQAIKESSAAYYDKDYTKAISLTREAIHKWPDNILLLRVHIAARFYSDPSDFDVTPELCRDAEIALIKAEYDLRCDNVESCLRYLEHCASNTRNGLVLQRVKELYASEPAIRIQSERLENIVRAARTTLGELEEQTDPQGAMTEAPGNGGATPARHRRGFRRAQKHSSKSVLRQPIELPEPCLADISVALQQQATVPPVSIANIAASAVRHQNKLHLDRQHELLREFAVLCESLGVRYYLFGDALRFAMRDGRMPENAMASLCIALDAKNCAKLLRGYKHVIKKNRYIESPLSNGNFPEFTLHYGDAGSLDLDTGTYGWFHNHGIHIVIHILTIDVKKGRRRIFRMLGERTWAMEHGIVGPTVARYAFHFLLSVLRLIMGRNRATAWLFRKIRLETIPASPKAACSLFWKKKFVVLPWRCFEGFKQSELEGRTYPVPQDADHVLKKLYGIKWSSTPILTPSEIDPFRAVSAEMPFHEFFGHLDSVGLDYRTLWKQRLNLLHRGWIRSYFMRKLQRDWVYLQCINDRYKMYKELMPLKKELFKAASCGDMGTVKKILAPYKKLADRYLHYNLCLYFDRDVFSLLLDVYRHDKQGAKAEKLRKLRGMLKLETIRPEDVGFTDLRINL